MSRIELKKQAVKANINQIAKLAPIEKVYAVLKDNAYGHGLSIFASLCASEGIKRAVVRNLQEAIEISNLFGDILCLAECENFDALDNVCFAINSIEKLSEIPSRTKIHLKVDSGMHRCGVSASEIYHAMELIRNRDIKLSGVFSHLRNADELSSETFWQEKNFSQIRGFISNFCATHNIPVPIFHIQNSAGLFRSGTIGDYDAARVGIALYGYLDMPSSVCAPTLAPVASLWGDKICSRELPGGVCVGYGGAGKIKEDCKVSVYDVGYADGFPRSKAYEEYVLPDAKRIIGRVSMDNMCVGSTDDSVCIFDNAANLARAYGSISYDILTRLSPKIKRVVVQ